MSNEELEVVLFYCKHCYVYNPIPFATTMGHRADSWDVNSWAKEVSLKIIGIKDDIYIRLYDIQSCELFAECPVPNHLPVITSVEPVVDSSRYYVTKVVDKDTSRHAFIGLGFRERNNSSEFFTTINDHRKYLERKEAAQKLKSEYESEGREQKDYRLKPDEKIRINLNPIQKSVSLNRMRKKIQDNNVSIFQSTLPLPSLLSTNNNSSSNEGIFRVSSLNLDFNNSSIEGLVNDDEEWGDFV